MKIKSFLITILLLLSSNAFAIDEDKQKHLAVSAVIGAGSTLIFDDYRYSLGLCLSAGIAKEVYDHYDYGEFDEKDLMYDAIGCGLGVLTGEVIKFHSTGNGGAMISFNYNF